MDECAKRGRRIRKKKVKQGDSVQLLPDSLLKLLSSNSNANVNINIVNPQSRRRSKKRAPKEPQNSSKLKHAPVPMGHSVRFQGPGSIFANIPRALVAQTYASPMGAVQPVFHLGSTSVGVAPPPDIEQPIRIQPNPTDITVNLNPSVRAVPSRPASTPFPFDRFEPHFNEPLPMQSDNPLANILPTSVSHRAVPVPAWVPLSGQESADMEELHKEHGLLNVDRARVSEEDRLYAAQLEEKQQELERQQEQEQEQELTRQEQEVPIPVARPLIKRPKMSIAFMKGKTSAADALGPGESVIPNSVRLWMNKNNASAPLVGHDKYLGPVMFHAFPAGTRIKRRSKDKYWGILPDGTTISLNADGTPLEQRI